AAEADDFLLDQCLSPLRFSSTVAYVGFDNLLQIIDVVRENTVHLSHFRIDVARNGDINEEHGPILAAMHEELAMFSTEDRVRSAGRGNHDIRAVGGFIKPIEMDCAAPDL